MIGTFVRAFETSSCIKPPMASVSPLLINTFESRARLSMIGLRIGSDPPSGVNG